MRESIVPSIHPSTLPPRPAGVYADLRDLAALQFKAAGFSFLPRQPVHSILAGRHASRLRGRGLNFEEIRRYLPGDDIRNMDWRVTARLQKPHVRVYTEERDRPCLLVVDQRRSMFFGSRRVMKSVVAAEAAALAAWRVFNAGDRVGALVYDDQEVVEIPPHRSRRQVMRILKAIVDKNHALSATAEQEPNPEMFHEVLRRACRLAHHDHLVCLIGDGHGASEETERLSTLLAAHNDVLAALVYDPLEARLPDAGTWVVAEGERQLELDTGDTRLRRRYAEEFQERLDWFRHIARQRQIPLLPISTERDAASQIRDLLSAGRGA